MAPKPREGAGSNCSRGSWPSTSAGVDGSACYGGSMTAPHKNAARPPATKACHGGLGDDVLVVEMFAKELTPSDVGKLNRLVIPKKHAMQHFSHAAPPTQEELSIEFVDRDGRWWTFRYCYWKSSQSFVFTKGWNRFVKEKRLRAKDTVTFYRCVDDRNGTYCLIDTIRHAENDRNEEDDKAPKGGLSFERRMKQQEYDDKDELTRYGDGEVVPMESKKKLRLFGEWIKIE